MIEAGEVLNRSNTISLHALTQVCDFAGRKSVSEAIRSKLTNTNISDVHVARKLREITNSFPELSSIALTDDEPIGFAQLTDRIITTEGICYSFNMLDRRDFYTPETIDSLRYPKLQNSMRSNWTVFGYDNKDLAAYPRRIVGSGQRAGVTFVLRMRRKDIDYACKDTAESFRLTLHTPDELPLHFYKIPFEVETLIAVQPRVMSTSENLKQYKPQKRQCYFPGEKHLKYFKSYTQSNCKLECLTGERFSISTCRVQQFIAEFILSVCGCVKFSMPHSKGTQVCGQMHADCIKAVGQMTTLSVSKINVLLSFKLWGFRRRRQE